MIKSEAVTLGLQSSLPENSGFTSRRANHVGFPGSQENPPIAILGVPFDNVTLGQAIERIVKMVESRQPHYLVTANVDFLVQAQTDIELRHILFDAHLVLCDGTPLVWASRFLGNPLPERVAGADLVPLLIRTAAKRRYRLFLLGAAPDSAQRAVANLRRQYPELIIAGHYSPPFNTLLEMDHEEMKRRIKETAPDLLLVSFGCPKQEKWLAMHYRALGVPVAVGVGATIDFLAGQVKRAPAWMQRCGAEWLFRLAQEPRRLFARYARDLWVFGRLIMAQWWAFRSCSNSQRQAEVVCCPAVQGSGYPHDSGYTGHVPRLVAMPERLDLMAAYDRIFQEQLFTASEDCVLQMEQVRFIDSTGVGLLIRFQKRLHSLGWQLILLAPGAAVQRALKLMRLEDFFATATDLSQAWQLIQKRREEMPFAPPDGSPPKCPLRWQGQITAANAEEVWNATRAHLLAAAESARPEVFINLSSVRFIDSSALGVMLRAKKMAHHHGTRLVFGGVPPAVRNVISLARLDEFLLSGSLPSTD